MIHLTGPRNRAVSDSHVNNNADHSREAHRSGSSGQEVYVRAYVFDVSAGCLRSTCLDGLYTKITGGQRVDLFGAERADLPSIWKELVDAGFESGHAYGERLFVLLLEGCYVLKPITFRKSAAHCEVLCWDVVVSVRNRRLGGV